jgi:transcriptional regulator with XRE-family HTH domain
VPHFRVNRQLLPVANVSRGTLNGEPGGTLGARLALAMKRRGVKNPAVAEAAGVHSVTVSKWRNDVQPPGDEELLKVAAFLDVEPSWLRYGNQTTVAETRVPESARDYGTITEPRHARAMPLRIRIYLDELRLKLTKGGADEEEIDRAMQLLRSPSLFTWYSVGTPKDLPEEKVLQGMKAVADNVILPELRSRGRKV